MDGTFRATRRIFINGIDLDLLEWADGVDQRSNTLGLQYHLKLAFLVFGIDA
jgi:hypothetical protein